MARLNDNPYPLLTVNEIKKPLLFVIDMINGFAVQGALADPGIKETAEHIEQLIGLLQCRTIFVQDAHSPDSQEFSSFPPHCLAGSCESEVIDELLPYVKERIVKNSTNTFMAPGFQALIENDGLKEAEEIILCGCCTDICVMTFALSLVTWLNEKEMRKRVIVVADCTDTYDIEGVHDAAFWNKTAFEIMAANGIKIAAGIVR